MCHVLTAVSMKRSDLLAFEENISWVHVESLIYIQENSVGIPRTSHFDSQNV